MATISNQEYFPNGRVHRNRYRSFSLISGSKMFPNGVDRGSPDHRIPGNLINLTILTNWPRRKSSIPPLSFLIIFGQTLPPPLSFPKCHFSWYPPPKWQNFLGAYSANWTLTIDIQGESPPQAKILNILSQSYMIFLTKLNPNCQNFLVAYRRPKWQISLSFFAGPSPCHFLSFSSRPSLP